MKEQLMGNQKGFRQLMEDVMSHVGTKVASVMTTVECKITAVECKVEDLFTTKVSLKENSV
jgi:hypothetical protein